MEVERVERATIGPILMQFVPSCRRWGRICKCSYHAVEEEDESIPLSEGRLPSPLSRVEGLGDLVHVWTNFGSSLGSRSPMKRNLVFSEN